MMSFLTEQLKDQLDVVMNDHSIAFDDYRQLDAIREALDCYGSPVMNTAVHDDTWLEWEYPQLVRDINAGTAGHTMQALVTARPWYYWLTTDGGNDTLDDVFTDYTNFVDKRK